MSSPNPFWPSFRRWTLRVLQFGFTQALVQLLLAAAGLLIIRTLPKPQYALFAITNSMQMTGNLLADLGIGFGVRSIGGRVWQDPVRFGRLLNTALGLRRRFALLALAVTLPAAAWMLRRNGAGPWSIAGLCAAVVLGVLPLLASSVWTAGLQLHGEYRRLQRLELAGAVLRLALIGGLTLVRLSALLAVLAGVLGNWFQLLFLRRWGRARARSDESGAAVSPPSFPSFPSVKSPVPPDDRRVLLQLSARWLPNVLFFCFQGQLTLLLLSLLGTSTGIADLTALGRVAALFAVFSATFTNVLAPRFARCQDPARLPRLYLLLVGGAALVLLPLAAAAWLYPAPFLWLLGPQYAALGSACGWVIATSCLAQLAAVMMSLNSSKAWLRFQSWGFIPAILATQALAAVLLDLRQFHNVLLFNFFTAAAPIPMYILDALRGLRLSARPASNPPHLDQALTPEARP